jgi:hypothetical protein
MVLFEGFVASASFTGFSNEWLSDLGTPDNSACCP